MVIFSPFKALQKKIQMQLQSNTNHNGKTYKTSTKTATTYG